MALSPAAVVILGPSGAPVARRIANALPHASVHGPAKHAAACDATYETLAPHLATLFAAGTPIVGVCAAGILVRTLAPHLADKHAEPPVVAVSEDGSSVVPLLGGHHGSNQLAREIAATLGGHAAITTAGDVALGFAFDAPPPGWHLAEGSRVKEVTAALLAREPVRLITDVGSAAWLTDGGAAFGQTGRLTVHVTDKPSSSVDVVLHPAVLALGVGCERDVAPDELRALARQALDSAGLSARAIACVASLDLKLDEGAVRAVAEDLGVPARFFNAATLEQETPRLSEPSDVVFDAVGCHGVAEAAALACAGPGGALAVPKMRSARATCAIARAPDAIDPTRCGIGRGQVTVVGIGPGTQGWRTPAADRAIAAATDLVAYDLYLDLLGPRSPDQTHHRFPLGAEEERVRAALDLAAKGRRVALVSSGDAGIYGMASLLFELVAGDDAKRWRGVDLAVEPGISAVQAAAARAGAPIGHDFCAISLSDLLTPWSVIEQRIAAAATGDFVVALYNPASRRRRDQLKHARTILAAHRPPDCPVVIARNLGRDGEQVSIATLETLDTESIDMLTLLIIGNSQSKWVARQGASWVYTPRGYAKDAPEAPGESRKAVRS
jgi:cobalt-precorrin 5A hydrolase/precorrin-3B C17-methyltransferase